MIESGTAEEDDDWMSSSSGVVRVVDCEDGEDVEVVIDVVEELVAACESSDRPWASADGVAFCCCSSCCRKCAAGI